MLLWLQWTAKRWTVEIYASTLPTAAAAVAVAVVATIQEHLDGKCYILAATCRV